MLFTCMGIIEQEISANERSVQDKTMGEICKILVIWCYKGPRRMDYWDIIIDRRFTKIGSYYWLCGNDDPHTVQPTWIIR